jgi:hypothetical protein
MKNTVKPFPLKFLNFSFRLALSCLFIVVLFYLIAPFFISGHLKLFKNQLELLHPEYDIISHEITKINEIDYIQFYIRVNKAPTLPDSGVHKGAIVKIKGQASTLCIAPIIIFSIILAWPGLLIKERLKAILLAIPMMLAVSAVDYPIIFIADIESAFSDAPILNTARLLWKHLMNNGGRQFLSLIACLASLYLATKTSKEQIETDKIGRNAPCPCGSGKKYKHCCRVG